MAKKSICRVCGHEAQGEFKFCSLCGSETNIIDDTPVIPAPAPQQYNQNTQYSQYNQGYQSYQNPQYGQPQPQYQENFGFSIAGLCTGITALCLCCYSILAIICGIVGIYLCKRGMKSRLPGMAKAGNICSIIAIVLGALSTVFWIVACVGGGALSYYY